jgi:LysM repeat protein
MRRSPGAAALEHVKIPRLGWYLQAAAILTVASATAARAQEVRTDSTTHTVKRGDTLWDLANSYLGDAYLWPEIYRLNTDQIEDPHWIYPGEVLHLPGRAAAGTVAAAPPAPGAPPAAAPINAPTLPPEAEEPPPRRVAGPTVFAQTAIARRTRNFAAEKPPARVPAGDVLRAPYFDRRNGPRGSGKILVGVDIPGIAMPAATTNFQLYDKVLMSPPRGSNAVERERYLAYELGPSVDGVGSIVIPVAQLQVVRSPRDGEAAIVEVVELYSQLDASTHIIPLDSVGAGATSVPITVVRESAPTSKIRSIYRPAVLPSLNYYVLFDLKAADGMRIGDEIEIYRERQSNRGDDGPASPEVTIATGQVVRVTAYGSTARITSQQQPAIREGESIRVIARMP